MAEERRTVHREEEKQGEGRPHELRQSVAPQGFAELSEVEILLRAVATKTPVEPTLEGWTRFHERLVSRVVEATHRTPTRQERRQVLYDRFTASDSRLKEKAWVIVAVVVLAVVASFAYLLLIRQQ